MLFGLLSHLFPFPSPHKQVEKREKYERNVMEKIPKRKIIKRFGFSQTNIPICYVRQKFPRAIYVFRVVELENQQDSMYFILSI